MSVRRWLTTATEAVVIALLAACAGTPASTAADPVISTSSHTGGTTYVAIGASETAGYGATDPAREAWPTVLHTSTLSTSRYVNLGVPGATAADAIAKELPAALAAQPTVATVWLNVNDLVRQVPAAAYEYSLSRLVHALRRGGSTTVLVANTPPLDRMPAYLACRPAPPADSPPCASSVAMPAPALINAAVRDYNAAISRVVAAEGAVLVDLHAAGLAARDAGNEAAFFGADGFHPSTTGHRAVAGIFAAALRSAEGH